MFSAMSRLGIPIQIEAGIYGMKSCRPITGIEIQAVARELARGPRETRLRNIALWYLMLKSGLRISEALTLKVGDVWSGHAVRRHFQVRGAGTKGTECGATLPLHPSAARVLRTYLRREDPTPHPSAPLFPSERNGAPLTRNGAWRFLRKAIDSAGLEGQTGWQSTRKSYCLRLYQILGYDLEATRIGMRHANLGSTAAYLHTDRARVEAAIVAA